MGGPHHSQVSIVKLVALASKKGCGLALSGEESYGATLHVQVMKTDVYCVGLSEIGRGSIVGFE